MERWVKPVCCRCGSTEVLFDAYVAWDMERGRHEIVNVFDETVICESEVCQGSETSVDWVEVVDP